MFPYCRMHPLQRSAKAVACFGSRPAVWSLPSRQNVSFGSLRTARLKQCPAGLQTRCLKLVLTPKRKPWIVASGTTFGAASCFGSRPAVWSLSSRQNVSFGSLRTARLLFKAVSRFGSRLLVWSLSSRHNVSLGSLREARFSAQLPASAPDPLSGACPHAKA